MENFFFYAYITAIHGIQTTKIFKQYANYNRKLAKRIPQRIFLLRCRKAKLVPSFIQNHCIQFNNLSVNDNTQRNKLDSTIANFQIKVLNVLITDKVKDIKYMETKLKSLEDQICKFNDAFINRFLTGQKQFKFKTIERYKDTNIKKFNSLKRSTFNKLNFDTTVNPNWFMNLSNVDIPNEVCWLLSLGPKFALPVEQNEFPIFSFIADSENILASDMNEESREIKRAQVANILNKERFSRQINNPIDAEIIRVYKLSKKFFKMNRNLAVITADKGNRTVLMDKDDYESKMIELLSNEETYRKLSYDTTDSLHARLVYMTTRFVKNKWITREEADNMVMRNSAMAKVYGQPKVHKDGIPLRLLVASYESPAYKVSQYLSKILQNITKHSKYNIKNASEFIGRIRGLKVNVGNCLTSFDVKSLFTNVPLDLLETILSEKWSEIEKHTNIPKMEFFQLLNFVLKDCNQFVYKDTIYKQIEGVPMGLPISPILADIVMEYIMDEALARLPFELQEKIKYVDDLFLINPAHLVSYVLYIFNSIHKMIQFTHEIESNKMLPYMDVLTIRCDDGQIEHKWYSKPTASDRVLSFYSNHPMTQKMNVVDNLIKRLYGLSSPKFHRISKTTIYRILSLNGYPKNIIAQRIRKYFFRVNDNNVTVNVPIQNEPNNSNLTEYRSMQYNSNCSINIGKILTENVPDLKLGFKPTYTNRSIFTKLKQKTKKEDLYDVVYNIPCQGNGYTSTTCDLQYVGTTGHKVKIRKEQHINDIKEFNRTNDLRESTALVHHYHDAGHFPDSDKISVLTIDNYTKRKVLESLHILTNNTINFRRDTENISSVYSDSDNGFVYQFNVKCNQGEFGHKGFLIKFLIQNP